MNVSSIVIKAGFDLDEKIWIVESSDVQGLNVEAEAFDVFQAKIVVVLQDLLEDAMGAPFDLPIEIIAHVRRRVTGSTSA
jgi:hypothetical protein